MQLMKLNLLFLVFCVFSFTSCSTDNKAERLSSLNNQNVKQITKPFSNLQEADTFRVVLTGTKPKDMLLKFTIMSFDGKKLYSKEIKASELLNHYKETVDLKKTSDQVNFIEEEFNLFFDDENFLEPAVTETEEADRHVPDQAFFSELKQSGLNGFKFRLGQESKIYIAWSEQENKVKVYYNCC